MRVLLLLVAACTSTSSTKQSGIDAMECREKLPDHTLGSIGEAKVALDFSGETFTTTFALNDLMATSAGSVDYPGQGQMTLVTSAATAIDGACVGKTVYYSYALSDDCTEVGLSRDRDDCELRIYNLDGATMVDQK